MMRFRRYWPTEAGKPPVHAVQVDETNINTIKTVWEPSNEPKLGDFAILRGSGKLDVVDETHFGDSHVETFGELIYEDIKETA